MKKLALGAVLGASLMISSSAFALTAMTDANMKSATGQAGVSIAIDNVVIEQYAGSTTYTDGDGTDGTAGAIEISDKHSLKTFLAMTSDADYKADFLAATTSIAKPDGVEAIGTWVAASALTIDVGNCKVLQAGNNDNVNTALAAAFTGYDTATAGLAAATAGVTDANAAIDTLEAAIDALDDQAPDYQASLDALNADLAAANTQLAAAEAGVTTATTTISTLENLLVTRGAAEDTDDAADILEAGAYNKAVAGVVIGLPTLLIKTTGDTYTVGVAMEGAANNGDKYIQITKGDSTMAILGGTVEIAAH